MQPAFATVARYLAAFAAAAAAVMLRWVVDPLLRNSQPMVLVFPAVYAVGRWLGSGPALLVLVAGLAGSRYFFFAPRGQFVVLELRHQMSLGIYAVFGLVMIWVVEQRRRHVEKLEREITNRQQVESELRLGREELRALAEKCPTGIFRTDADGNCTYVNEYWCRLSGRPPEAAMGRGWGNAIHPDDLPHVLSVWDEAFAARRGFRVEYRIQRPEGPIQHAITTAQPVNDERGGFDHYIGTVLDITDQRQAYVSLKEKERVLRNLIDAQEHEKQAIGNDIHDGLLQYAIASKMLLESLLRDHPEASCADVIRTVQGYLAKGIAEGRQVVRGVRPPVLDDLGLEAALQDLATDFDGVGLKVECRIDADLATIPPALQTTVYRITQEALNNARKHSGSDRAMVSLRLCDGGMRLDVRDHGHGFDIESTPQQGCGLIGITERVRLAGGILRIDSSPGQGTLVSAELPLDLVSDD